MITSELRDTIYRFVDTDINVQQLEEWLVPRLPFFLRFPDSADANIVSGLELGLAEIDAEIISEQELRDRLLDLLQEYNAIKVTFFQGNTHIESGSSNQTEKSAGSYTGHYQANWSAKSVQV
jgi:hypothetical protein